MLTSGNTLKNRLPEAEPLGFVGKKIPRSTGRLFGTVEIDHAFTVRPKNFSMLPGVFNQHTTTQGRDFEAAHHMTVAVGASNQT